MIYKYKGKEFIIEVCNPDEDWREHSGYFRVENDQPYGFDYKPSYKEMKEEIKKKYDEYHENVPTDRKGWIKLFESCVIREGYEDWSIDEGLAMRLLNLYCKNKEEK